jgi:hypothetical protein
MAPERKNAQTKPPLKTIKVVNPDQQLCTVRFNPDGKVLAAGTFEGSIRRWDAASDAFTELPAIVGHQGWVQRIVFHADNQRLFAADSFGQLACWNIAGAEAKLLWKIKDAHDGWIHSLALSPDGSQLATCARDRTVRIASSGDGKPVHRLAQPDDLFAVAFHPEGKSFVTGDLKGAIRQWDCLTGKVMRELDARSMYLKDRLQDVGGVRCFAFDSSGGTLLAGGSVPKSGGFVQGTMQIIAFDWQTGKAKSTVKGSADTEGYVFDMVFHPDGYFMAVTSGQPGQGKLFLQRLEEAQAFMTLPLANCHALALSPDGLRLVVSATNGNSAGNGRQIGKGKEYPGNFSPLHVFEVPKTKT